MLSSIKICLTCSAGGHRLQLLQLENFYKKYDHFFLTFKERTTIKLTENNRVYFIINPRRNPIKWFIAFLQSILVFLKEKPTVIISTGAGVTIPIIYLAKFFGKKTIYIESFSRIIKPSMAGIVAYPVSDLFIVQWKPLLKFYKNAVYGGSIF